MAKTGRPPKYIPVQGDVYGRLTVTGPSFINQSRRWVPCRCNCGTDLRVRVVGLLSGNTKSCGCLQRDSVRRRNTKHGAAERGLRLSEYSSWEAMKERCSNSKLRSWKDYGGRGIKVCERWGGPEGFVNFLADMGPKPSPRYSIERVDVNGNYEPGNCRWATAEEQSNNTRRNRRLVYEGRILTLTEWAAAVGVSVSTMHGRLSRMSLDRALTLPPQRKG